MPATETFQPRRSHQSRTARRRVTRRDPVALQASIYSRWFDQSVFVETCDLSPDGMFLVSDLLLERGEKVMITFAVPGTAHMIVADAEVVRVSRDEGAGMGLAFATLTNIDEHILRTALARRRDRLAIAPVDDRAFRA